MKTKLVLSVLMALMLLASSAMAYDLRLTPGGSTNVISDSFFDVFVEFVPDEGGNKLGSFGFNLFYDTNELTYSAYQLYLPSPLGPAFMNPFESPSGKINNLSGNLPFGQTAPTISNPYTLAKITFSIDRPGVNTPVADGQADVWFDTGAGTGFTIDGQFKQMSSITRTGAPDIAVAPEPVSSMLFLAGSAVLGLRGHMRRKRQSV